MPDAATPGWHPWAVDGVLAALLILATIADLRARRIYDVITVPAFLAGLALAAAGGAASGEGWQGGLGNALLGALVPALFFGLPALFGAVGLGDAKLMAAVGALLGFPAVLGALIAGTAAGGVHGVGALLARTGPGRRLSGALGLRGTESPDFARTLPYGPALAIGTAAFRLWQRSL